MQIGKAVGAIAAFAVLASGIVACGSSDDNGSSGGDKVKVAMVLPGPINDEGFNQSGYEGLKQCESDGAEITYQEKTPVPDFVKSFETLAQSNDVVIGHGFEFGEIAHQVAPDYPDVDFVVTSNPLDPEDDNVQHLMPNSSQGAYLAGVAAGKTTTSNKIGGIAGFDFPVLEAQMAALEAGAQSVNPQATVDTVYLGTFDDVAKGKEAARSQAASGVDVIYHIADAAGVGVIDGAEEEGVKAIGWGVDQSSLAPKTVIASQIVDQAKMIGDSCQQAIDGDWKGGLVVDGLQSGIVELTPVKNAPAGTQEAVDKARKAVIDGSADVPSIGGDIPGSGEGSN
ncbi:MAG: BMP family protein [Solirubrobacterales bacterium]|nr:BMP family protein [Solirubrobacterales bacterium]